MENIYAQFEEQHYTLMQFKRQYIIVRNEKESLQQELIGCNAKISQCVEEKTIIHSQLEEINRQFMEYKESSLTKISAQVNDNINDQVLRETYNSNLSEYRQLIEQLKQNNDEYIKINTTQSEDYKQLYDNWQKLLHDFQEKDRELCRAIDDISKGEEKQKRSNILAQKKLRSLERINGGLEKRVIELTRTIENLELQLMHYIPTQNPELEQDFQPEFNEICQTEINNLQQQLIDLTLKNEQLSTENSKMQEEMRAFHNNFQTQYKQLELQLLQCKKSEEQYREQINEFKDNIAEEQKQNKNAVVARVLQQIKKNINSFGDTNHLDNNSIKVRLTSALKDIKNTSQLEYEIIDLTPNVECILNWFYKVGFEDRNYRTTYNGNVILAILYVIIASYSSATLSEMYIDVYNRMAHLNTGDIITLPEIPWKNAVSTNSVLTTKKILFEGLYNKIVPDASEFAIGLMKSAFSDSTLLGLQPHYMEHTKFSTIGIYDSKFQRNLREQASKLRLIVESKD